VYQKSALQWYSQHTTVQEITGLILSTDSLIALRLKISYTVRWPTLSQLSSNQFTPLYANLIIGCLTVDSFWKEQTGHLKAL